MDGPDGKMDGLPSEMQMPERPPMGLQRAVSMAGNVLVVLEDQGEQGDEQDDEQGCKPQNSHVQTTLLLSRSSGHRLPGLSPGGWDWGRPLHAKNGFSNAK